MRMNKKEFVKEFKKLQKKKIKESIDKPRAAAVSKFKSKPYTAV